MKKKSLVLFLILVLIMGAFAGCGGDGDGDNGSGNGGDSGDVFKVGAIYPMSGNNALLGTQCMDAVKIAVDFVNEEGGINGMQVELFTADAPDPTTATTETSRLVDREGVQVIFGSLASGNALAIAGVADVAGVALVESGGVADEVTDSGYQNVFRILDKGSLRGATGSNYVAGEIADMLKIAPEDLKVYIVHEESSYGESVASGAEKALEEHGVNLVGKDAYNVEVTDMSSMILKIKAAEPDVLMTVSYVNDAILLVDQLRQYDAVPKVFMGLGAGTTDPEFATKIGEDSDGFFCTDMPTNLPLEVFEEAGLDGVVERFREEFLKLHPDLQNAPIAAEAAFAGAYTFMHEILPKAETLDSAGIREAAINTNLDMTTLGFGWDLGEDGQNYAASANVNQWQGGEVRTISPASLKNGDVINVPLPIANY